MWTVLESIASTAFEEQADLRHRDDRPGAKMVPSKKQLVAVFVDRPTHQWIVRDPDGVFWIVPLVENCWDHRQPFEPTEETDLEPIPGHYNHLLGLPF